MTAAAEPVAKKEGQGAATEYVILEKRQGPQTSPGSASGSPSLPAEFWVEVGRIKAANAAAAVIKLATGRPDPDGTYLAVSARSWVPKALKVETKKIVSFA